MTWAAVGTLNPNTFDGGGATTFSLTPAGVGNLIFLSIGQYANATVYATALSSSNVTWTAVTHSLGSSQTYTESIFIGKVTAASAATVTITWSGTAPSSNILFNGQEFSSTVGSWSVDTSGVLTAGTTTFPSLSPAGSGELYVGSCMNTGSASAGSTSGFTYEIDTNSNGLCYNLNCSSPNAYAPVWGDSGEAVSAAVLVAEASSSTPESSSDTATGAEQVPALIGVSDVPHWVG